MKKKYLLILLIILMPSVLYGYESQYVNVYVRQDVFEARMDRLEAIIGEKLTQFQSQIRTEIQDIRGDIRVLDIRMNSLETVVYWGIAIISIIFIFRKKIEGFENPLNNIKINL